MTEISVVITTYNRAKLISDAIDSVLKQSYDDFEVIVVDDGSTDRTNEILGNYGDSIRVIYQKRGGVSKARNRGIAESKGKYIAFLDSDDMFFKRKLEIQMNSLLKNPDCNICYTNEKWLLNGKHKNQHLRHKKHSGWIFDKILSICLVSPSSVLIKKEILDKSGGFDEKFIVCEDFEIWLRLSLNYQFLFIDRPLVRKRGGHDDQLSHKYWGMDRFRVRALEKVLTSKSIKNQQKKIVIDEIVKKCNVIFNGALKRNNLKVFNFYKKKEEYYNNGNS